MAEMGIWASPTAGQRFRGVITPGTQHQASREGTLEPGFLRLPVLQRLPDREPVQDETNPRWGDLGCQQI